MGDQQGTLRYSESWKGEIMAGTYYAALAQAQSWGAGAKVVPYGGTNTGIKYKAVPPPGGIRGGGGGGGGGGNSAYASLLANFQKREAAALASNEAREAEVRGTYDEIIGQGQGAFRTAGLADIEEAKTKAVGAGTQQLISSGMYGTTTAASLPVQAENQAARSRLKLEDLIQQRTNTAKLGKAAFVERISEPYPDYNILMQAAAAGASA
ncbi:MAG: hypothetical protein GY938_30915 [Ketobacter sp.]|nr:hypothetical protein [Ketobacter sp.]